MKIDGFRIQLFRRRVEAELRDDILPFWLTHAPDQESGGFVGAIRNDLSVEREAPRGVILNARILWTFARAFRFCGEPALLAAARRAYEYFGRKFVDSVYSGVYWMLDSRGSPIDSTKKTYAQAFACYALAEYSDAAADSGAAQLACGLMHTVVQRCRDSRYGGYFEAFTRDWAVAADQRLSEVDLNEKKSMNAHLHLLEACTGLVRLQPDGPARAWLRELLEIHLDRIVEPRTGHFRMFFSETWEPRSERISFGHDIEGSWLLCEAAEVLGDDGLGLRAREMAVRMARAVYGQGRDSDGAILYEGDPTGIIDDDRHWWPQAEAVVGFLNAFVLTGDEAYFAAAESCWAFIECSIVDRARGEWFWKVSRDGVPDERQFKVDMWKCPYHNSRACIETIERLDRLAG
jgi:cellobiose epimerase